MKKKIIKTKSTAFDLDNIGILKESQEIANTAWSMPLL